MYSRFFLSFIMFVGTINKKSERHTEKEKFVFAIKRKNKTAISHSAL